jgi:hypothetical protein
MIDFTFNKANLKAMKEMKIRIVKAGICISMLLPGNRCLEKK